MSANDSIVKVNLKIRKVLTEKEFKNREMNLLRQEAEQIEAYFPSPRDFEMAKDSLGFYWVEKPDHTPRK